MEVALLPSGSAAKTTDFIGGLVFRTLGEGGEAHG